MTIPIIALLTDFGTRDPFVAAMKAVIAGRCEASILDLSHEIAPYDVAEAAFFLDFIASDLERGRFVVVAVVDPGVGTGRRILALQRRGVVYLAPDNGILSLLVDDHSVVHAVNNESFFLAEKSATFHGRDRFAPVAAAVASGTPPEQLGPATAPSSLVRLTYAPPDSGDGVTRGRVIAVDRFGNIISDLHVEELTGNDSVVVKSHTVRRFARTYEEGRGTAGPFAIIGSRGTIEISISGASAADLLHIARFDPVELHREK